MLGSKLIGMLLWPVVNPARFNKPPSCCPEETGLEAATFGLTITWSTGLTIWRQTFEVADPTAISVATTTMPPIHLPMPGLLRFCIHPPPHRCVHTRPPTGAP